MVSCVTAPLLSLSLRQPADPTRPSSARLWRLALSRRRLSRSLLHPPASSLELRPRARSVESESMPRPERLR
jgi:hypothetical protein